jgi:2-dehydropantoate 2-reductase
VVIAAGRSYERRAGVSWREANALARAMAEGFARVRRLGNVITPAPKTAITGLLWTLSRVPAIRTSRATGFGEPRALIDAMVAAAPGPTPAQLAVRPLVRDSCRIGACGGRMSWG